LLFPPKVLSEKYRYQAFQAKSQLYMDLHDNRAAAVFADSALAAAEKFNPQMTASALQQVFETQKLLGNHERALSAYERYSTLRDSLANIDKFQKINALEQQYNKVKNEKSIRELTQDKEIILLRNRLLALGVLIAALIIAVLVFLQRQRALKNRQTVLETEQRLQRSRMNPHFFFNALGALQGLALKSDGGKQVVQYLSKFAAIMRQTLESTYNDRITLAQEKQYLEQYLDLQKLRFPDTFHYHIDLSETLDEDNVLLPPMLLQPFAENAIEHGFSNKDAQNELHIRVSATTAQELLLEIDDNGKGLQTTTARTEKHISRATQIIQDRLMLLNQQQKANARVVVQNKPEGGVLAQIYLPLQMQS
jgi:LytS/YehU family sensor histidine kinase